MEQSLDNDDFARIWSLSYAEREFLDSKPIRYRLGIAVQLKFFSHHGHFIRKFSDIPVEPSHYLAEQLEAQMRDLSSYDWDGRSDRRYREDIISFFGIHRMSSEDRKSLSDWVYKELCPHGFNHSVLMEHIYMWCRERKIWPSSSGELERLVRSVNHTFEDNLFQDIVNSLDETTKERMEQSLATPESLSGFHNLKADFGRVSLESFLNITERVLFIKPLGLPRKLISSLSPSLKERFFRRINQETAWDIRRHPVEKRLGLFALFLCMREEALIDGVVDLLIETIHKMTKQAEHRVTKQFNNEIRKISGKERLLALIAEASLATPDRSVRTVIFPVVQEQTLEAIAKEYKASGSYDQQVYSVLHASYKGHYRRMLPKLLETMDFQSNNVHHRPVLEAIACINNLLKTGDVCRTIDVSETFPLHVVLPKWRDLVVEQTDDGTIRINRISYEICILTALREKLRCKEIWVKGAYRYRNPDEDLPQDFAEQRVSYYESLGLTEDATAFVANLKEEMAEALYKLNDYMPRNPYVHFKDFGKNRICLSPLSPAPVPENLEAVKTEIERRWSGTSLLDVVKEAALQTGFLKELTTSGDRVILDPLALQRRQILCLYGLGTNTGLKRVSTGIEDVSYSELLHVRRRYIHKDGLRAATARLTNGILALRDPAIWGEQIPSCASDSKKFGAWDQNLMTEWHARYHGRGVMIYWHVERRSTCIYSQLKRCSSSEVASMIEGVLRHCTDADIQSHYVDSHGQSEVAFAFCRLLHFELAPRLKAIARQKLYLPDAAIKEQLDQLIPVLTRTIKWELIEQQYDEMVKYTAALRHKTADPEVILRRFTRSNVKHPTYQALMELGKAVKTIFLCRYLSSEPFRREIHTGLNVVENWNSANSFIFFGKGGEIATNRLDDQEVAVLALHLLQNCLVYVNTLMLQRVLSEQKWKARMTSEDWRGLTPLIYPHVSPYGAFNLNLDQRINFEQLRAA